MSAYDALAADFDRLRAFPDGIATAIRQVILRETGSSQPLVLDLGAGSGRFGAAFVAEGDRYVAADLSLGMLRGFAARRTPAALLVQADGERLPFADATFGAVLLMQVLNAARDWRQLIGEARRVLRRSGALFIGRREAPEDGIDARMKRRLAELLTAMGVASRRDAAGDRATHWLTQHGCAVGGATAATWTAECTPRAFLERHARGAHFATLPAPVREAAMLGLREWAVATFGSLDAAFVEPFRYDLVIARPQPECRAECP
jgi:SAM-dependent methyltransferase